MFSSFCLCVMFSSFIVCAVCLVASLTTYARAHSNQVDYQEAFNSKVARLLDLTQPDLGYVPPTMHAMAPATMQATAHTTARTTVPAVRGA